MALVKNEMESVYKLSVPLLVEVGSGPNWRDAKLRTGKLCLP